MTVQSKIGSAAAEAAEVLARLGVPEAQWTGGGRAVRSPVTGEIIGRVHDASAKDIAAAIEAAHAAFLAWRNVPAPRRG
ncbi:MAG TPA: aldehyde dehydrogenase family protein, partial [Phenylobacterium sp.]